MIPKSSLLIAKTVLFDGHPDKHRVNSSCMRDLNGDVENC